MSSISLPRILQMKKANGTLENEQLDKQMVITAIFFYYFFLNFPNTTLHALVQQVVIHSLLIRI